MEGQIARNLGSFRNWDIEIKWIDAKAHCMHLESVAPLAVGHDSRDSSTDISFHDHLTSNLSASYCT